MMYMICIECFGVPTPLPAFREKPGGSGMLDVEIDGRGNGDLRSTTHLGGGRGGRVCGAAIAIEPIFKWLKDLGFAKEL